MSKSIAVILLATIIIFSIIAALFNSQNHKINELVQIQQQLADKNQNLRNSYTALNQQIENIKSNNQKFKSASNVDNDMDTTETIIKSLNSLQLNLSNLDLRIEQLETNLTRLTGIQAIDNNPVDSTEMVHNIPATQSSFEQRIENAKSKQNALTQYFQNLDQTILQTLDTNFTQTVQYSYEDVINSREDWANETSVKSSECGAGFCKIVLNYKDSMDPVSQIEFDAMAYSQVPELPNSRSQYRKNPDGTTDIIIYAARKGSEFPLFEN